MVQMNEANLTATGFERCYACLHRGIEVLPDVRDFHTDVGRAYVLASCRGCGSSRVIDGLSDTELARIYPDEYYSYAPKRGLLAACVRLLKKVTYDRHRFVPEFRSLLEIGCGYGEFLATIASRGSVIGLERSAACRAAATQFGLDVKAADVETEGTFAPGSFDWIYLNHAFEHLQNPDRALRSIDRWLEDGGRLFIGIPNRAGVVARIFGNSWYHLGPPLHVTAGTPRGMRRLLERHGFEVERIAYNSDPFSVPMSVLFAVGGNASRMSLGVKIAIGIFTIAMSPIVKLLDVLRLGDCIEIHARKRLPLG